MPETPVFPAISERDLRAIAWNSCGVLRNGPELEAAYKKIESQTFRVRKHRPAAPVLNCATCTRWRLLIRAPLWRAKKAAAATTEQISPQSRPAFQKHSVIAKAMITFRLPKIDRRQQSAQQHSPVFASLLCRRGSAYRKRGHGRRSGQPRASCRVFD